MAFRGIRRKGRNAPSLFRLANVQCDVADAGDAPVDAIAGNTGPTPRACR